MKATKTYIQKKTSIELTKRADKLGRSKYRLFEILEKMPLSELRDLANKYII